jgi:hypothetical protein
MRDSRKIKCPWCGNVQDSKAEKGTRCNSCHKNFTITKSLKASAPVSPAPEAPSTRAATPAPEKSKIVPSQAIKVEHLPETRHEPEKEQKSGVPGEEVKPEIKMISPAGIYSIFIELPNNVIITIVPSIEKDLALTDEEVKMFKDWAMQTYDYCLSHGITIPDYLELLPILMTPAAFYLKRARMIISARQKKKEEEKPKPEPPTPGVDSNEENERKARELADMQKLEQKLKGGDTKKSVQINAGGLPV